MADLNLVVITGRITKDPDMRFLPDGTAVTKFSVAVNGYKKDDVQFVSIVAWRKTAEFVGEFLKKGYKVAVKGKLTQSKYINKDGIEINKVEVTADEINNLTQKIKNTESQLEDVNYDENVTS